MISVLPLVVLILVVLSATLAASETALFSMARLEHTREQMSLSVQRALDRLMSRMEGHRDAPRVDTQSAA